MAYRTIVNNFTRGELDPRFLAMVDYDGYHKGCRVLKNTVSSPQGGCKKRFGTIWESTVYNATENTAVENVEHVRIFGYEYNQDEKYFILIRPDSSLIDDEPVNIAFDVFIGGTVVETIYPPVNTYTVDQIREIRWASASNSIVLFHNDVQIHRLIRNDANDWECKIVTLKFFPAHDYTQYDDPENPYTSTGETFTPSGVSGASVTVSRSAGASTPFTDNHVGGLIFGNSGVLRITTINSNISVTGYTLSDFDSVDPIRGDEILIAEKAWGNGTEGATAGAARGWPAHGCFFQGRMFAAGWKIERARISASNLNDYFNFDDWDDDPSGGFSAETGSGGNDVVNDILGYKSLISLGFKGPSSTSILQDGPLTPSNVYMPIQDSAGSSNIDGAILNNMIIFVSRNYETVYGMAYEIPDSGYSVGNLSALSAHLISEARWAQVFDPPEDDGKYYLLVNEDGTLAVYQTIAEENIKAWTVAKTVGSFIDVASSGDETRVLVRRKENTEIINQIEGSLDYIYDSDPFFSYFLDINNEVSVGQVFVENGSYLVLGSEAPFSAAAFELVIGIPDDLGLEFQYLSPDGIWHTFEIVSDTTLEFTQSGTISWSFDNTKNWGISEVNDIEMYWIRIKRTMPVDASIQLQINTIKIDTIDRIYIEKLDFDVYMDCQSDSQVDPEGYSNTTGSLVGQKIFLFVNGFPVGYKFVSEDGSFYVGKEFANLPITIGIDTPPKVIPMPVVGLLQNGYNTYHPQHIVDCYLDYYESLALTVNGQPVVPVVAGEFLTTRLPKPISGVYEVPVHKGWDPRQEIVISQSYPAPFTIRGIGLTVEIT